MIHGKESVSETGLGSESMAHRTSKKLPDGTSTPDGTTTRRGGASDRGGAVGVTAAGAGILARREGTM